MPGAVGRHVAALTIHLEKGRSGIAGVKLQAFEAFVVQFIGDANTEFGCSLASLRQTRLKPRPLAATDIILSPDPRAWQVISSQKEYNPLTQQDVVHFPDFTQMGEHLRRESKVNKQSAFALGFIETQGFTAVFEAIDSACKAANVEVVGKEKLGGGYVTVIVKGDVAAVKAAIDAGKLKVEGLGQLIAAHVIAHPSPSVLGLLPPAIEA